MTWPFDCSEETRTMVGRWRSDESIRARSGRGVGKASLSMRRRMARVSSPNERERPRARKPGVGDSVNFVLDFGYSTVDDWLFALYCLGRNKEQAVFFRCSGRRYSRSRKMAFKFEK